MSLGYMMHTRRLNMRRPNTTVRRRWSTGEKVGAATVVAGAAYLAAKRTPAELVTDINIPGSSPGDSGETLKVGDTVRYIANPRSDTIDEGVVARILSRNNGRFDFWIDGVHEKESRGLPDRRFVSIIRSGGTLEQTDLGEGSV